MPPVLQSIGAFCLKYLAPILGGITHIASQVPWRKVLIASVLSGLILVFGQVLTSFFSSLLQCFRVVFPNTSVVQGGTPLSPGVLRWFGLQSLIAGQSTPALRVCYMLGIDWVLWGVNTSLVLWLLRVSVERLVKYATALAHAAYLSL